MKTMKKYIRIDAKFERDGTMLPIKIIWDNGAEYPISEVIDVRYFKTDTKGATGIKYTCNRRKAIRKSRIGHSRS